MAIKVIDELQLSSLKTSLEILKKKKETIHQSDTQTLNHIEDPDSLEDIILEIKETQNIIFEKINQIETYISLRTRAPVIPPTSTTPLISTSSLANTESTTVEPHPHVMNSSTTVNTECTTVTMHRTSPVLYPSLPLPKWPRDH